MVQYSRARHLVSNQVVFVVLPKQKYQQQSTASRRHLGVYT